MRTMMNRIANPVVRALLRSPFHGVLSRAVMLITVTGRRTGTLYTVPVQFTRRANTVYVFSPSDRRWWRNLNGSGSVTLRIGTEKLTGVGDVLQRSAADDVRAQLAGTSLAKSAQRYPDGVIVRVKLDPAGRS